MFVLRFKPNTHRLLYSEETKGYVQTDISGRYFTDNKPTRQTGYSTTSLNEAKVFNQGDGTMSSMYFADCEPVPVEIVLK